MVNFFLRPRQEAKIGWFASRFELIALTRSSKKVTVRSINFCSFHRFSLILISDGDEFKLFDDEPTNPQKKTESFFPHVVRKFARLPLTFVNADELWRPWWNDTSAFELWRPWWRKVISFFFDLSRAWILEHSLTVHQLPSSHIDKVITWAKGSMTTTLVNFLHFSRIFYSSCLCWVFLFTRSSHLLQQPNHLTVVWN